MALMKEFREFAVKGNVVDMAVGIIIGGAFGTIVKSLVDDVIMPPIGLALGNVDFTNLYIPLSDSVTTGLALAEAKKLGPVLAWGSFVSILLNFVILAFCIFMIVKAINTMRKREPAPAPAPPQASKEEKLLAEIRDILRSRA